MLHWHFMHPFPFECRPGIVETTSVPRHNVFRLFLAPAYIAVFSYFISGALGLLDMTCTASKETRRMINIAVSHCTAITIKYYSQMHWNACVALQNHFFFPLFSAQSIAASFAFLLSSGAAVMANILRLPELTAPVLGQISTVVVDFVGIVLMSACYVSLFKNWKEKKKSFLGMRITTANGLLWWFITDCILLLLVHNTWGKQEEFEGGNRNERVKDQIHSQDKRTPYLLLHARTEFCQNYNTVIIIIP